MIIIFWNLLMKISLFVCFVWISVSLISSLSGVCLPDVNLEYILHLNDFKFKLSPSRMCNICALVWSVTGANRSQSKLTSHPLHPLAKPPPQTHQGRPCIMQLQLAMYTQQHLISPSTWTDRQTDTRNETVSLALFM